MHDSEINMCAAALDAPAPACERFDSQRKLGARAGFNVTKSRSHSRQTERVFLRLVSHSICLHVRALHSVRRFALGLRY